MKLKKEMITVDNPQYEKKSKKTFLLYSLLLFILGALGGFLGVFAMDNLLPFFSEHKTSIIKMLQQFQLQLFPWIMLSISILCFIIGELNIQKGKKQITAWDGEDDAHIAIADCYLNRVFLITNILLIITNILLAAITYNLFHQIDNKTDVTMIFVSIIFYFFGLFIGMLQQNRALKLLKEYAPEKQGSLYDKNFKNVWFESCDEAERDMIYKASYKTFQFMNTILNVFLTVTTLVGMFIPIGILCAITVGIIWLLMSGCYMYTVDQLEHGK